MTLESAPPLQNAKPATKKNKDAYVASRVLIAVLLAALLSTFFVIVNAGERGVLMQFGRVQEPVLGEGIHLIVPGVNTVKKLSVRVQNQEISAEASSKDLQDVYTDVALNWHIIPDEVDKIFQQIGDEATVVTTIINPAVEEVLKAVVAMYTAEEVITKRGEVKAAVDQALTTRLGTYHIAVDDISLVHVHFSKRFSNAVEAKQVAEQEAKRAEFVALKAAREAKAKVNLAKGEAEAQNLLREGLTPELLQKQAIEKWNGNLPLIMGDDGSSKLLDLKQLVKLGKQRLNPD
ncbi:MULTISPECIES: prohibitin family protein [Trichocoleus]|uniref:Prohibitin family protein n=1 Tax=Trichocoleus desertorum GB2-A4 TaxID=2933944 RepID=A0ABV0JG44_9CYAN|nr:MULTISPECIES: prohibitin family protein [unclassified Trichocoleus]MBD1865089.1 prohibitin family protein [Trichocoleus sp. FACHB-46]MBD2120494.1 prohibitin family protein [Trichocoleus sp. FACHB-262]